MRHLKTSRETDAGQIKEQDVPLTSIAKMCGTEMCKVELWLRLSPIKSGL